MEQGIGRDLVDLLIELQGTQTGEEFARRLGVNPATWSLVKRRLQGPNLRIVLAAFGLLPDDELAVCRALRNLRLPEREESA